MKPVNTSVSILNPAVVVAALGYFVDVFDLQLFGVLRVKSLASFGLSGQELTNAGLFIQNWQMVGLLIGGILSGVLGDKLGRVQALYFSIALYSAANIWNGFIGSVEMYALCRFVAGIGLAGELGSGVTLVAESLPTEKRGLGTTLMASFGVLGAVAAGMIDRYIPDWHTAYFFGGGLGLLLLAARLSVRESEVFRKVRDQAGVMRGNFLALFQNRDRLSRLLRSTLLGATTWFIVGILMYLSPEFAQAKGISEPVKAGIAVIWFHIGMASGDVSSGLLSQYLRSRVKALRIFLSLQVLAVSAYLFLPVGSALLLYGLIGLMGFTAGFWAVFITNASEQFGTNLRATAACTIPSFVRGLFVPISLMFAWLKGPSLLGNPVPAAAVVGLVCFGSAFWASFGMKETFSQDLDFLEQ